MAPLTLFHNNTLSLATPNGTVILVQGADNPWTLDLNTLVTIVFGIVSIAFQASHVYRRRTQKTTISRAPHSDVEDSAGSPPAYQHRSSSDPWNRSYHWDYLSEHEGSIPGLGRPASATPIRATAPRQPAHYGKSAQLGIRNPLESYAYRRNPWRSNEWAGGTMPRPIPTGPALLRQQTHRRQPGFS